MKRIFNEDNFLIGLGICLLIIFLIAVWREFQWYAIILPLIGLSTFFVGYVANKLIDYLKK
jgi:glyoxylate utilization-related uncharacterized protein